MKWLPPFAMHCTFICDDETLQAQAPPLSSTLNRLAGGTQNG
jgi:putative NADPH-quinone reductase